MKAIITCLISGEYTLYDSQKKISILAKPRGIFRNNKTSPKVGDVVEYTLNGTKAIIEKVCNNLKLKSNGEYDTVNPCEQFDGKSGE